MFLGGSFRFGQEGGGLTIFLAVAPTSSFGHLQPDMTVRRPKEECVATESNLGTYGTWLAPGDLGKILQRLQDYCSRSKSTIPRVLQNAIVTAL